MMSKVVQQYRMKALQGQQGVRKDATFQTGGDTQRISAGKHNGKIGAMVPIRGNEAHDLVQDAMVYTGRQAGVGIAT